MLRRYRRSHSCAARPSGTRCSRTLHISGRIRSRSRCPRCACSPLRWARGSCSPRRSQVGARRLPRERARRSSGCTTLTSRCTRLIWHRLHAPLLVRRRVPCVQAALYFTSTSRTLRRRTCWSISCFLRPSFFAWQTEARTQHTVEKAAAAAAMATCSSSSASAREAARATAAAEARRLSAKWCAVEVSASSAADLLLFAACSADWSCESCSRMSCWSEACSSRVASSSTSRTPSRSPSQAPSRTPVPLSDIGLPDSIPDSACCAGPGTSPGNNSPGAPEGSPLASAGCVLWKSGCCCLKACTSSPFKRVGAGGGSEMCAC
mmetsp:Transcript_9722/g.22685  ORF Transcript_9722/g.22685 Transcript_9722/m.22685 type:complete len:321 (-) Transcript_9722:106-1068(-)